MMARLALRLLWREWRSGELRLLLIALCIAVTASCAVGFFTDRVERALLRQATEFLGADLVLRTARPFQTDLRAEADRRGLRYSEQLQFPSMLIRGEGMLLSSIKSVDDAYPLKGALKLAQGIEAAATPATTPPPPGVLWVERRVLESLGARVGDSVELGNRRFRIGALLLHEPDRGGGLFNLRPRVLMNRQDLDSTGVIQPGSRVRYRYLFNGPDEAISAFKAVLQASLQPGQRLLDIHEENPSLGGTLSRAQRYLNLSGLLAVLMAAVAITMAARRYSERHFDGAALMRCFGSTQGEILRLYALQLLIAGTLAALLGVVLGWLTQYGLVALLTSLLPASLPGPGWKPATLGFATGLLVLAGTALPPLLRLASVPPLRVLRRELSPLPASAWLVYGLTGALLLGLLWAYSRDLRLTLLIFGGGGLGALVLGLLGWWLLRLAAKVQGPLPWRLATKNLRRHPRATLGQLLAFGLTLGAMALILSVRSDLLQNWRDQLPANAPNHFLINIQPGQVTELERFLDSRQVDHSGIFPMVRGRLSEINGRPATEVIPAGAPGRRATRRELNLTWSAALAPDNRITAGRWWQPSDQGQPLISVEQELARDLGVGIGDQLGFDFGGTRIQARIQSLRSLEWSSLRPNFFVIFPPGALDALPASYITSFHLPPARGELLNALMREFPTLTLLEVDALLSNIRAIVAQVALAVEYVLLFVMAAGITVLFSALATSLDERLQEGALMRALGSDRRLIRRIQGLEFLLLGGLAGLLACVLNEAIGFWLYRHLLDLDYHPSPIMWALVPLAGGLLVALFGLLGTRRVLRQSPIQVLRDG